MQCNACKIEIKKLKAEVKKYKELSLIDPLTKLWNRRQLDHDIKRYLHLKERVKTNFLVVMIDVDGLKKINDTRGHKEGDNLLMQVGDILKNNIRSYDKAFRISGDEFVLLLSHSKKEDLHIIKRIRKELKKYNIKISIGYNELCENVLEIADKKMYKEKRRKK